MSWDGGVINLIVGAIVVASMIGSAVRRAGRRTSAGPAPGPAPRMPADGVASRLPPNASARLRSAVARVDAASRVVWDAPGPGRAAAPGGRAAPPVSAGMPATLAPAAPMQPAPAPVQTAAGRSFVAALGDGARTRDAIVLGEILAPPLALR